MQKATHINVWLTTTLLLIINTLSFNIFVLFYYIISLIQDADHWQGTFAKKFWFSLPFKHRGFTHTLLFIILLQGLINLLFTFWLWIPLLLLDNIFLFILLHAHLFADIFTVSWLPYLWPFYNWNIKIPWISIFRTWTNWEYFFNFVITLINIFLIYLFISGDYINRISWILETQNLITSSPLGIIITFILFILFSYHLVKVEFKNLKKDTKELWKKVINMIFNLIFTWLFLFISSIALQHFVFPIYDLIYFLWWAFLLTLTSWIIMFNKHLEFISKTGSYLINILVIIFIFLISFNIFWITKYFNLEWITTTSESLSIEKITDSKESITDTIPEVEVKSLKEKLLEKTSK